MDSQGRKVVVCDNGTGVSLRTGHSVKFVSLSVLWRCSLIRNEENWKQEVTGLTG